MKVDLTLNSGSFFFAGNVNLTAGLTTTIDVSDSEPATLQALKTYIASGIISADPEVEKWKAIKDRKKAEPKAEPEVVEVKEEAAVQEVEEQEAEPKAETEAAEETAKPARKTSKK